MYYASFALQEELGIQPVRKKKKRTETMVHSAVRNIDVFEVEIEVLVETSSSNQK